MCYFLEIQNNYFRVIQVFFFYHVINKRQALILRITHKLTSISPLDILIFRPARELIGSVCIYF